MQYYSATMINNTDNSELLNRTKDLYIIDNGFSFGEFDIILEKVENYIKEKDVNSLENHQKNIQSVLSKQVLNHFITTNKKSVKIIGALITEYLKSSSGFDKPHDCGFLSSIVEKC